MNAELLYEALNDQHSLEQLNAQELDRLVTAHPYFSIGQLLLAKKYRQERDQDSYQTQRACLQAFYRNPWWLYYQLELSDNITAVPRSPYAPGYIPEERAPFETIARQPGTADKSEAPEPVHVHSAAEEETLSAYPLFPTGHGEATNEPIPGQSHAFVPWPDLDEPIAPTLAAAIPVEQPAAEPAMQEHAVAEPPAAEAPLTQEALLTPIVPIMPEVRIALTPDGTQEALNLAGAPEIGEAVIVTAGALEIPVMPVMVTPVLPDSEPEPEEPAAPAEQPVLPSEAPAKDPPETGETAPAELPSSPGEIPEMPEGTPPESKPSGPEEIPGAFPREGSVDTPKEIPEETPWESPGKIPLEIPSPTHTPEMPGFPDHNPGAEPEAIPAAASAPSFPFSITPLNTGLTFEPFHTVDYFASQGIKLETIDENATDKLSQHMKSFTEWLRTMKRINATEPIREELDTATEAEIQHLASSANRQKEAVVTESMALVWVHQGRVHKAIEVYHKLSLQHPEKRAYFASKIEQLNKQ
jgi:hypothetical protein